MSRPKTPTLLDRVHERLGGLGVHIELGDVIEARWRRDYDGEWSDERSVTGLTIDEVLQAILDWEDDADRQDALA